MSAFSKLTYHIVFSTKYRRKLISDDVRERLYEYMGGIVRGLDGCLQEIGGIDDHVQLLVNLPPSKSLSNCIRDVKANASKRMNEIEESITKFEWQKGYGAFTVSHSQVDSIRRYIQNQKEHHREKTFKEEFIALLQRHQIPFEDKFLFEAKQVG